MSQRLDKYREHELQPKRMAAAIEALKDLNLPITYQDDTRVDFTYKDNRISFWPYSGWHSGKGIIDGRGFKHLFDQLKP